MTAGDVKVVRGSLDSRQAAAFDGTDDYILADAHAVARVAANDTVGTYSAWIYADNIATTTITILSAGDNDNTNETLQFYIEAGRLRIRITHGGATQFTVAEAVASMSSKKWYHVAVVQNGTQPVLYIDGEILTTTNLAATDLTYWYDELSLCDKFAIGTKESNNTHTNDWAGMISDVKYWNLALTAKQIWDDYTDATADAAVTATLQLHLLDGENGITDQGLGADDGTLTGHAYLCGWGSEWSRLVELNALVADETTTYFGQSGEATTLILKAA